ncbi:MAG: hypothetical protein U9R08_04255 [Nanoarchaeota archaeon]|nr:hypothetical protein [Nanoarchaeota archaeon]
MVELSNLDIDEKEGVCYISINPKIYPLDVISSAAYVFLDRAYLILDGDPDNEVVVEMRSKFGADLKQLGLEFNNELLNYLEYSKRAEKSLPIRTAIMQRALLTNDVDKVESENVSYLEDPENIAVLWEEKHEKDES